MSFASRRFTLLGFTLFLCTFSSALMGSITSFTERRDPFRKVSYLSIPEKTKAKLLANGLFTEVEFGAFYKLNFNEAKFDLLLTWGSFVFSFFLLLVFSFSNMLKNDKFILYVCRVGLILNLFFGPIVICRQLFQILYPGYFLITDKAFIAIEPNGRDEFSFSSYQSISKVSLRKNTKGKIFLQIIYKDRPDKIYTPEWFVSQESIRYLCGALDQKIREKAKTSS